MAFHTQPLLPYQTVGQPPTRSRTTLLVDIKQLVILRIITVRFHSSRRRCGNIKLDIVLTAVACFSTDTVGRMVLMTDLLLPSRSLSEPLAVLFHPFAVHKEGSVGRVFTPVVALPTRIFTQVVRSATSYTVNISEISAFL